MQLFDLILAAKILVTALAVVIPLFVVPVRVSAPLLGLEETQMRYMRLYALAVGALLIGYASGFSWWRDGGFPYGIAIMGLVSNGGAAVLLAYDKHVPLVRIGAAFFGLIAVALAASLFAPDWAMKPL
ncbi:hypothetical protein [Erythrobacter aurantius]|uniref:hypothetical protein n=1 Tax=Erythrobacter aurantius TaxID=2909249 RepID=UPI0020797891|nr:hypothetical protein [Erythrobacter aurantius]